MVTLKDRVGFYDNQNGTKTILAIVDDALVVPEFNHLGEPQQATTEILGAILEADIEGYLAAEWLSQLLLKLKAEADRRVDLIITADEVVHWIGVSNAISRKHDLWLAEKITAGEEQRPADEATYPPITDEEHQTWFSLALIQGATSAVRGAAMANAATLNLMTSAEKLAVTEDDITNHILWP